MKPTYLFALLSSTATALNDIFIPLPYPECNSCLDTAANSCPGNYRDRTYAECICAGTGSKLIVGCVGTCDAVDTMPMGAGNKVVRGYYSYCIMFFPEMCAEAVDFVNPEFWEQTCGQAGGGVGSGGASGSGSDGTPTELPTGGSPGAVPTGAVSLK
ncbi:hypothetical protein B0T14DRAFT_552906 [Immersiella caudata]|uniref:Extracellular membrane protein CFEM domain-containing protein n=1 Tax=Immersiella caudata TaxID=314043 RepID=A0AA39WVP3_9PEZI|nr:hypothetical protein B0T14DRAFT_552906 [Immersiella caudata]